MAVLSTLKHHGSYDRTCLIYDNLCLYITILKTKVPKLKHRLAPGQDRVKLYAYFSVSNANLPKETNLKQCRNICILDPLCKAFRFGDCDRGSFCDGSDRTCFIYHQITNLPSETKANTEFHFIAK